MRNKETRAYLIWKQKARREKVGNVSLSQYLTDCHAEEGTGYMYFLLVSLPH